MDIRKFPANIYKVYLEYKKEQVFSRKLQLMFDLFGQIIRFFGCVFLSEYMYSKNSDSKVNDSIIGLTRPSLGSWLRFIEEYSKFIYKNKDSFIVEVGDYIIDICTFKKYDLEYHGRFRKESVKQSNAFEELLMLRNTIAHGAICPSEEEAEEIVEKYDQYIQKILDIFYPIFEKYTVAKVDEVENNVIFITVYFDLIRYDEKFNDRIPKDYPEDAAIMGENVLDFFQEGKMYLISNDDRVLKMTEYLVDIIDDGEHEDYYLYDGYGNRDVVYIGMKYKKQIGQYLESIKSKFVAKGANTKWNKRFFDYESFVKYINDLASLSIHIHEKTGKYNKKVYVERECDYLFEDFLTSDKTTMIVTAEAGVGKTNFLCHSAEKLIKEGKTAVYFFNGNTLTETKTENILFHKIQNECLDDKDFHNSMEFLQFLTEKNEHKIPMVLFIDAANEAYDVIGVLQEIDKITSNGDSFPWLKIIMSIRSVSFQILKNRITDQYGKKLPLFTVRDRYYTTIKDNRIRYSVEIEEWNILQVLEAFEKYKKANKIREDGLNFHLMSNEMQELLHNPLNMGLFFWAQISMPDRTIETEEDLYKIVEDSWQANDEVTSSMSLLQGRIVNEMIREQKNELDADYVHEMNEKITASKNDDIRMLLLSPLERLEDEGIVYEKESNDIFVISFVYQKYLEYLLIKRFKKEGRTVEEIIGQLLDSKDWQNLPEMYIACLGYLTREQKDDTAQKLYDAARKKEINANELQTAVLKLWHRAASAGDVQGIVSLVKQEGLYDWGLKLVQELYQGEESQACYTLVDLLLEDDSPIKDKLYFQRGLYYMKVSENDRAERDFEYCLEHGRDDLKNNALVQLAKNYRKKGDVTKAKEILTAFIDESEVETPYFADALIQRGLCSYSDGDAKEALDYYEEALQITEKNKDYYVSIYNMLGISTAYANLGDLEKCESVLIDVYKRSTSLGYIDLIADCLNGLSANYVRKKEYEKALSYAKQGLLVWKESNFYTGQAVMYCTIIKAYLGLNKIEEAAEYLNGLNEVIPLIKEKVILNRYTETLELFRAKQSDRRK